jgi:amino acid transporter
VSCHIIVFVFSLLLLLRQHSFYMIMCVFFSFTSFLLCVVIVYLLWLFRRVRKNAKNRLLASSCLSVRPSVRPSVCLSVCLFTWNNSAPTERILIKFDTELFTKCVKKFQFSLKSDKNNRHFTLRLFHIYDNISLNSS